MNLYSLQRKKELKVIGLMSGTSLDGLDICYVKVAFINNKLKSEVFAFESIAYSENFKKYLKKIINADVTGICKANFDISREWSVLIERFLKKNNIEKKEIDLIGSHGQTVWHIHGHSTLQLGEASVLTQKFSTPSISDFRVMDIAAGGSGAPLVPFIDYLWFKDYPKTFLLLNIGGIANFTIIPKNSESQEDICALDTGPGNGLIDAAISILSNGDLDFDKDGIWANKGKINSKILKELMEHPYFLQPLPKSTGKEVFGESYVKELIKKYEVGSKVKHVDFIATLTSFTAESIYYGYINNFSKKHIINEIIVTGGGANNPILLNHLKELFSNVNFGKPEDYGINPEAKEAHAFAILAALRIWEIPANVPKVTGAKSSVLLGKIIN